MFALRCVCCSFKVCGFPLSHHVGKPVRKVCWESCAHGVPAHGQTDTAEITCHWTGAWPQNKGLMHSGLLKALLLRTPLSPAKTPGHVHSCGQALVLQHPHGALGRIAQRRIRTAVIGAQQQLATGSVPRWRCQRCRSWHSGAT